MKRERKDNKFAFNLFYIISNQKLPSLEIIIFKYV